MKFSSGNSEKEWMGSTVRTFILALLFVGSLALSSETADPWTPSLKTPEGQTEFLSSILQRHPEFPRANLQFNRNPFETLNPVPDLLKQLGPHAQSMVVEPTRTSAIQYSSTDAFADDEKKISEVRQILSSDLGHLEKFPGDSLAPDAKAVVGASKKDPQLLKAWLRLLPLRYNSNGSLLPDVSDAAALRKKIEGLTSNDLSNHYADLYQEHLKPTLAGLAIQPELKTLAPTLASVENQFIQQKIKPALTQKSVSTGKSLEVRTVSIQKIPASVSIYRGALGGDCSMHSVPYYGLIQGTESFWIRKSLNAATEPEGYVFVALAEVDGRKIPYVVTGNGVRLASNDIRAVAALIAKKWGTNEILVPDFSKNPHLVNTEAMRDGLTGESFKSVKVKLPEGWSTIEEHSNLKNRYSNYYKRENLESAKLVRLKDLQVPLHARFVTGENHLPYQKPQTLTQMDPKSRAILAAQLGESEPPETDDLAFKSFADQEAQRRKTKLEAMRRLGVTPEHYEAATYLLEAPDEGKIKAAKIQKIRDTIGFDVGDLLGIHPHRRASYLGNLFRESPNALTEAEWKKAVQTNEKELYSRIRELNKVPLEELTQQDVSELSTLISKILDLPKKYSDPWAKLLAELASASNHFAKARAFMTAMSMKDDCPPEVWDRIFAEIENPRSPNRFLFHELLDDTYQNESPLHPRVYEHLERALRHQDPLVQRHAMGIARFLRPCPTSLTSLLQKLL